MSSSTVASPPPPLAMEKNSRRVRFSLPEAKLTLHNDKRAVHGTSMYVNGTLINVTSTIHSTTDTKASTKNEGGVFKSSLKTSTATPGSNGIPKESSQYKVTFNVSKPASSSPPPNVLSKEPRHSLPTSTTQSNNTAMMIGRRRMSKSSNGRHSGINTLPIIGRKSSSAEDIDEREREIEQVLPITNLNKYKSSDDLRDLSNFRMVNNTKGNVLRLPEAMPYHKTLKHSTMASNVLRVPDLSETQPSCETNRKFKTNDGDTSSCDNVQAENQNMDEFFEFVEKWRTNRLANNKKIEDIFRNSSFQSRCSFKNSESKRLVA